MSKCPNCGEEMGANTVCPNCGQGAAPSGWQEPLAGVTAIFSFFTGSCGLFFAVPGFGQGTETIEGFASLVGSITFLVALPLFIWSMRRLLGLGRKR